MLFARHYQPLGFIFHLHLDTVVVFMSQTTIDTHSEPNNHNVSVRSSTQKAPRLIRTFLQPRATDVAVIVPFPAAELKHVDGHGGSDLLLGQAHPVVENLEEPLGLLLLVQLAVEGVLLGRRRGDQSEV